MKFWIILCGSSEYGRVVDMRIRTKVKTMLAIDEASKSLDSGILWG